jgi:predicted amidohydrolase
MTVRVAACAYPIEEPTCFDDYAHKQTRWVEHAVAQSAQLLVFPEYATMELTRALPASERGELQRELHGVQPWLAELLQLFSALATKHQVHILGPSFPERDAGTGKFFNRARLHAPNGRVGVVEKVQMTRFEAEHWGISPGQQLPVFETELGLLGVAICYDSEFPLLVRKQVEQAADIVLVPSCTDTLAGYHRVALSCRARALENQCYIVQAPTVGTVPSSLVLDQNRGAAAIYGPIDRGFADDGVIATGTLDTAGWTVAELDIDALRQVRSDGQVRNHRDWQNVSHAQAQSPRVSLLK